MSEPRSGEVPPEAAAVVAELGQGAGPGLDTAEQAQVVQAANAAMAERTPQLARAVLPRVLADTPVAVLVMDRDAGSVTYANQAAVDMAGRVSLPVPIDEWGAAAGLTDLAGGPLEDSDNPLSRLAQGQPISGEAVRLQPRRSSDEDRAAASDEAGNRLLWVTGFPLAEHGTPSPLALVVFLQLDHDGDADSEERLQALRDRAVLATDVCFTISDPTQPDNPLVWVNPAFARVTGYNYEDVVGRNCRFLQGPATDPTSVDAVRRALHDAIPITVTLLNYRKDGTAFWNELAITPVFDGAGQLVSFVGVQSDVTARVQVEGERAAALAAEQAARATAEEAQARLALMAEATAALTATLDMDDLLDRLARLCVPMLADWMMVFRLNETGRVSSTAYRHRDGMAEQLAEISEVHAFRLPADSPTRQSLLTGETRLVDVDEEWVSGAFESERAAELFRELGGEHILTVPMLARSHTIGAIALLREQPYAPQDVELATDLARRAALAIDNVRLYQQEHSVAEVLQRSLLPVLPEVPGLEVAAHYESASTAAAVGGDFYDLLRLPDGSVGIAVGDVVGHDIAAAATMGQLRGLLRACAWDEADPDAVSVMTRLDRLVDGLQLATMATAIYVRAVPPSGADPAAGWRLRIANAGHPPPLLRHPSGEVAVLSANSGLLLGVDPSLPRYAAEYAAPPGSTLITYTDGLVEQPGTDIETRIRALADRIAALPPDSSPHELCSSAMTTAADLSADRRDDVALITVRFS